jgi:hypothetical protein
MGYGSYSAAAHEAITSARKSLNSDQVFEGRECHPSMRPFGVTFRESRDSPAHPDSVGVIFALDVTASMGDIPMGLAQKTLPTFMTTVLEILPSAQVMFMALGNAYADRSPLQVGQFESEAHLIDQWLSRIHVEGGGGALGESYDLAMRFASRHTKMDCLEKRGRKGYLLLTGDEPPFAVLGADRVRAVLGDPEQADVPIHETAREALESFHCFFLIPDPMRDTRYETGDTWRKIFHERVIVLDQPDDTAHASALVIGIEERTLVSEADIGRYVEQKLHRKGSERDRLVRAVTPFAIARAKGPIAAPEAQETRPYDPTPG